ncbi:hypothetical protein quinque_010732 [Culex quinquefasciatus]
MSLLVLRPLLVRNQRFSQLSMLRGLSSLPQPVRTYATAQRKSASTTSLSASTDRTDVSTDVRPMGERVKENTKTASYLGIILLFSSNSPNNIYTEALDRVKNENRVKDALGAPIKGFGEESRRGRRTHVAHTSYIRDGVQYIRMQFYVQGIRNKATVHLEKKMNESGDYEYRYLFVQLDYYPHTTVIIEDNRLQQDIPKAGSALEPIL